MARCFSGTNLRRHRIAANKKIEEVALYIDRSSHAVIGYEHGKSSPQAANLGKIADLLGISVEDLYEDDQAVKA